MTYYYYGCGLVETKFTQDFEIQSLVIYPL